MGELIRCISQDGFVTVMAADTTDIVEHAREIHGTAPVVSAGLGRLLTAAAFFGAAQKSADASVTLRVRGDGPVGSLIAVTDAAGHVRGYAENAELSLPLNEKGKLDVAGAVGPNGTLTVMRDLGFGEPYIGQIPLISGEIAEDITQYYAVSEQIPTVCALGVLVNSDRSIAAAGGFLIQLLPGAGEETLTAVERCVAGMEPVTKMLARGMTARDICGAVLPGFALDILDSTEIYYRCSCDKNRVSAALISLGRQELEELAQEGTAELCCHFCEKKYRFTPQEIRALAR